MKRSEIFDEWRRKNVGVDDGIAFRTDELVEMLYHEWRRHGAPEYAYVSVEGLATLVVVTAKAPDLEV